MNLRDRHLSAWHLFGVALTTIVIVLVGGLMVQ
jgi:hypothetical protein